MKTLHVSLAYSDFVVRNGLPAEPIELPVRVLDAQGSVFGEGVAKSGSDPVSFPLPTVDGPVFVRLTWPSGRVETKRVDLEDKQALTITFSDAAIAQNEWSAWAVPRLGEKNSLARTDQGTQVAINDYNRVWLRLWRCLDGKWAATDLETTANLRNDAARQIEFELKDGAWLLQLGGSRVPWRFVSLPSGPCRVLLTPNESHDPRADPLKIVVSGFRNGAETLLEFLSRDSLRAANALSDWAVQLLRRKFDDPIAATVAAYYVLRVGVWRDVPEWWFDNLNDGFTWLADGALIRCVVDLRRGLVTADLAQEARNNLHRSMQRGYPLFAEGISLLQEARAILGNDYADVRAKIDMMVASRAWAGGSFSFYGETPEAPSPGKVVGLPFGSRRAPKRRARWLREETAAGTSAPQRPKRSRPLAEHAAERPPPALTIETNQKALVSAGKFVFLGDLDRIKKRKNASTAKFKPVAE